MFFTWVPGILLGEQIPVRRMASERKTKLNDALVRFFAVS
jgi:hypothetical protein